MRSCFSTIRKFRCLFWFQPIITGCCGITIPFPGTGIPDLTNRSASLPCSRKMAGRMLLPPPMSMIPSPIMFSPKGKKQPSIMKTWKRSVIFPMGLTLARPALPGRGTFSLKKPEHSVFCCITRATQRSGLMANCWLINGGLPGIRQWPNSVMT